MTLRLGSVLPVSIRHAAARAYFRFGFGFPEGSAAILTWHRIDEVPDDPVKLAVHPARFEEQIRALRNDFAPMSLMELVRLRREKKPIPPRAVVLTFDDGCRDNFVNAFPILARYRLPATFFLFTGFLDGTAAPSWKGAGSPLSWDDARKMRDAGMELGAHTATHPHLGKLSEPEIRTEIAQSKRRIEEELGIEVKSFAYPYGQPEDVLPAREICRSLGFDCALSTYRGVSRRDDDPFAMHRIPIGDWDAGELALRLSRTIR